MVMIFLFSNRKFLKSLILINHFKNYFFQRSQNNICVSEHTKNMLHRYTKFKTIVHHGIEEREVTNLPKIDSKKVYFCISI